MSDPEEEFYTPSYIDERVKCQRIAESLGLPCYVAHDRTVTLMGTLVDGKWPNKTMRIGRPASPEESLFWNQILKQHGEPS